ncbi:MAG: fumarylacetoacetate hydrolase family protein [Deltaproteobacteria bacterium]|nr:fumarylacetoacetate hydrolase family protein [Deltaproteobacteria bacterium]
MRLASIYYAGREQAGVILPGGLLPLDRLNARFGWNYPGDLLSLLETGSLVSLNDWFRAAGEKELSDLDTQLLPAETVSFAPLYRRPRKIWGIGLNYKAHARDLSEKAPETEPASFMKPDTTIIGPGDTILIPRQSERTTAEAELGIVIGKECKNVPREDWLSVVAGFTTILDMTAEDILRRNPRYLTRSKSFDTFFSFGPLLVTPDEIDDVQNLTVSTVLNGQVRAYDRVDNMTFPPDFLVSFHSAVMTLLPGDIISTGTPGAAPIQDGDRVECRIDGFETLFNPVRDLKNTAVTVNSLRRSPIQT